MNARLYDPMLHRFLQVDNYIQAPTNTQNYNQYGYVLNTPLLYTDPSGNAAQGNGNGKDCVDCGWGAAIANGVVTLKDNWDEWGIKDWAKKNLNIKNWGKSINKWFGGGHKSSEPVNRSSYVNLNNASFSVGQMGMNNFVSKTVSETVVTRLIPESYFVKLEANNTFMHGNSALQSVRD